jgi:GT2 family glycosyltransferase
MSTHVKSANMLSAPREEVTDLEAVRIIVLNWNGWEHTLQCLEALDELRGPAEILVVDNGSTDGSEQQLRSRRPDLEIIQSGANLGYAGGNNIGLRLALERGEAFAWVLNNDTRPEPSALVELLACMRRDLRLGVLASRARTTEGRQQEGLAFSTTDARAWNFFGEEGQIFCSGCPSPGDFHHAASLAGPSLFFRTEALAEVGLFDESYFHFFEETDLVERLRVAGWGAGLACRSSVHHEEGAALSQVTLQALYYLYRNHLAYRKKRFGVHPLRVLAHRPLRRLRAMLSLRRSARGDFRILLVHFWAITDALRGRDGRRDLGPRYLER